MKKISFILPIYNEEKNIPDLFFRLEKVREEINYEVEILFINDGSIDNSLTLLRDIADQHNFVKIINFSRNFGHQIAITAGLDHCSGEGIIIMDSDLQDPPEVCFNLIKKWEEGYDIVYAKRKTRKDSFFKKFTAYVFYRLLKELADVDIPSDTGDFRLLDRKVVNEINKFREKSRFMRGLTSYVGFKQSFVLFDRDERVAGCTKYPLRKMIKFALDGITGFSIVPLRIITYVGFFTSLLSCLGVIYSLASKIIIPDKVVSGWTFITIAIFFIGGVQMVMLGIIGEYVGRIYTETQNRPLYIIKEKTNFN